MFILNIYTQEVDFSILPLLILAVPIAILATFLTTKK